MTFKIKHSDLSRSSLPPAIMKAYDDHVSSDAPRQGTWVVNLWLDKVDGRYAMQINLEPVEEFLACETETDKLDLVRELLKTAADETEDRDVVLYFGRDGRLSVAIYIRKPLTNAPGGRC